MSEKINNLFKYINDNYKVNATIEPRPDNDYNIYIEAKKVDINIGIGKVYEKHFLYGKYDYYLCLSCELKQKYRKKMKIYGGSCHDYYNENDFSNIDSFLSKCLEFDLKETDEFDLRVIRK